MTRPMIPPSASISRTRWPFPIPPMAGLQDICPIRSRLRVRSAVLAPSLAAADAASHPACPPPITITSNASSKIIRLLSCLECQQMQILTCRCRMSRRFVRESHRLSSHQLFLPNCGARCEAPQVQVPRWPAPEAGKGTTQWRRPSAATDHDAGHLW